jgi:hypothetical protein
MEHELSGKKYLPSNGTEGMSFTCTYCDNCIHEKFTHTQRHGDKQCDILNKTLLTDDYVDEWVYNGQGVPICTAWVKWDWGNGDDEGGLNEPPEPLPYDPNQLVLPFAFEVLEKQHLIQQVEII